MLDQGSFEGRQMGRWVGYQVGEILLKYGFLGAQAGPRPWLTHSVACLVRKGK